MITKISNIKRLILLRLNPGEDILQSIRKAVKENNIRTGAILNGVGSVSRYHVHVVKTTNIPPGDEFFKQEGPHDILSIEGFIIDGRVHAHITLSNTEKALGGHMEEGCRVLTFAMITLAEIPDTQLTDWDKI